MRLHLLLLLLLVLLPIVSACTERDAGIPPDKPSETQSEAPSEISPSEAPSKPEESSGPVNANPGESSDPADLEEVSEDSPSASTPSLSDEAKISRVVPHGELRFAPTDTPTDTAVGLQLGLQEDLDAWKQTLSDVARIDVSNMSEVDTELTSERFDAIMATLRTSPITIYDFEGNPPTGGGYTIVAYDATGTMLWHITHNGAWLVINMGRGFGGIYNGEDPALVNLDDLFYEDELFY
jgi:hypothetical protein